MTATTTETKGHSNAPTCRAIQSDAPEVLDAIHDPDQNLAIWERDPAHDWGALLDGNPSDIRFEVSRADVAPRLAAALATHGFGGRHLHRALVDDVAVLSERFCSTMGIDRLELRLEIVTTDSCRKFHADYVTARLISSYIGPGTQWLDEEDAARIRKGEQPHLIRQMKTGDVGIFKGKLATEHPAIHRSPPIATSPGPRLLLVLNWTNE